MNETAVQVDTPTPEPAAQHKHEHKWRSSSRNVVHVASECLHCVPVPGNTPCDIQLGVVQSDLQSDDHDITVTAFFRSADKSDTIEVFKAERVKHHHAAYTAAMDGDLVFLFDNTYSWFNEKDVDVVVQVGSELCTMQERAAEMQAEPAAAAATGDREDMEHANAPGSVVPAVEAAGSGDVVLRAAMAGVDLRAAGGGTEGQLIEKIADLTECVTSLSAANGELQATVSQSRKLLEEKDEQIALLAAQNEQLKSGLADKLTDALARQMLANKAAAAEQRES